MTAAARPGEPIPLRGSGLLDCVRELATVARETSYVALDRDALNDYLHGVVAELVRAMTEEPFSTASAYQLGGELVAAHFTGPEISGRLVKVLGTRLLPDLGQDFEPYRSRLAALLGATTTGYARALRDRALDDQETIVRASLAARTEAERALWESENKRWHEARHDPLTGLPNRLGLAEALTGILSAGTAEDRVGLCLLDLDRFHALNDTLGPDAADRLLAAVADRLLAHAGGRLLARLGGDEFALVTTGPDDLVSTARSLLAALAGAPLQVGPTPLTVTASAGLIERPVGEIDLDELLRSADIALTWAKADGRDRWSVFEAARNKADTARWSLAAELPAAVRDGALEVHYQPMVGLADGRLRAVEALVRWQHPRQGLLLPGKFIAAAEETGLVVPLGRQVLAAACAEAAEWASLRPDAPRVSVNLAAGQMHSPGLVKDVLAILAEAGLPPDRLQLEVLETAVIQPGDDALTTLRELADAGIRIAVDDFGTGQANHSYLRRLPLHELKLAAEFVTGLGGPDGDPLDQHLAASLIDLGHTLGLTVTAEGVETAHQSDWLRDAGCDTAQGWFYAPALPAAEMRGLVTDGLA
ncbi:MAG TPA: bifunctional diguanylate cyclase/phosphodiesterase [Mycobacteriales bacterium]|nr:bifunctional diguanylate cyclase/phosphodiesterase [Mycobacteriales bacterium]